MADSRAPPGQGGPLDPSQMPPVPLDQVLVLLNRFVKSTGLFLNDFATECDARLASVSKRVDKLTLEVALLEAKFHSLHDEDEARNISNGTSEIEAKKDETQMSGGVPTESTPTALSHTAPNEDYTNQFASTPAETSMPAVDPRLNKYMGMLRVGIPRDAVVIKMQIDGLENLIDKL